MRRLEHWQREMYCRSVRDRILVSSSIRIFGGSLGNGQCQIRAVRHLERGALRAMRSEIGAGVCLQDLSGCLELLGLLGVDGAAVVVVSLHRYRRQVKGVSAGKRHSLESALAIEVVTER